MIPLPVSLLFAPMIWFIWELLVYSFAGVRTWKQLPKETIYNPSSIIFTLATYGVLILGGVIR